MSDVYILLQHTFYVFKVYTSYEKMFRIIQISSLSCVNEFYAF